MSDQYGIVGSPATLACVGISPGGNVPTLSIYRGETLLTRTDAPQLTTVSFQLTLFYILLLLFYNLLNQQEHKSRNKMGLKLNS